MIVVGAVEAVDALVMEEWARWRLKLRTLVADFGEDEMLAATVLILSDLAGEVGEQGLVCAVQQLLLRVLLLLDESLDEPLVLELSFRSLLKAPLLEIGGLEGSANGACARRVSGAAYSYASVGFIFFPRWKVLRVPTSAKAMRFELSIRILEGRMAEWAAPR